MNGFSTYLRERFPLPAVLAFAIGTSGLLVGFVSPYEPSGKYWTITGFVALAFVAFLLRIRVTDEFKDAHHDDLHYPGRPVQRGVITRPSLVVVGVVALTVEIGSVVAAGVLAGTPASALWYLAVLAHSALTAVEFFVPNWLERHFTTYFISHQLISVWFAVWAIALFATPPSFAIVYAATGFVFALALVEIVRKFEVRTDSAGAVVPDTYPTVWGRTRTLVILAVFAFIVGERLYLASGNFTVEAIGLTAVIGIVVFRKSDAAVRTIAMLSFLATATVEFFT
ncbi:MAG: hypothetical protein RLZZ319_111 [Actinomycetota bacterium]